MSPIQEVHVHVDKSIKTTSILINIYSVFFCQVMLCLQIGSLTVNFTEEGHPELLVAQPGGEYVTMTFKQGSELDLSSDSEG